MLSSRLPPTAIDHILLYYIIHYATAIATVVEIRILSVLNIRRRRCRQTSK